ncbi:DNA cytosine methyltransferase [Parabacteroides goldsteinii]|nr:DNA cytosine methyltransferase [Parabacteroides goldsteinii]
MLTEVECERLQGFPDDFTKYGKYGDETKVISRINRYALLGNAVSVPVVKTVSASIKRNTAIV